MMMKFFSFVSVLTLFGVVCGCRCTAEVSAERTCPFTISEGKNCGAIRKEGTPFFLTANDLSIASANPSLVTMATGGTSIPVWSLSGGTVGQSVAGLVTGLPAWCAGVKVEIVVTTSEAAKTGAEDVYRVHLSQMQENASFNSRRITSVPVRTPVPVAPYLSRTIVLESYYPVDPKLPLSVRIQREPGDPADTFLRPAGLALVKVTPLAAPADAYLVQGVKGYNSWPMIQSIGKRLVCTYCRGSAHTINEDARAVYARTSDDFGKTWSKETVVANTPGAGEVTVAKGLDEKGAMLLWVRRIGKSMEHDLYRTTDGVTFRHVVTPKLAVKPMQITDVFTVQGVGLMSLWFAGTYRDAPENSWGTLVSRDNGATWTQKVVESGLKRADWPTEPSAVCLGKGRILVVARTEEGGTTTDRAQFQLESSDSGVTWSRRRTNIGEVSISTPSLILDAETGLLSNYYYERGRGVLRRRVVDPKTIFGHPLSWPASEAVAIGSAEGCDAGNVNSTFIGKMHFLSYYSGKTPNTSVFVAAVPAPENSR